MTVTADDLDSVISCVMSGLLPITDRDWSVPAGTLEWDCWHTAEHIADSLLSYAWQLAVQPTSRYVRAVATAQKDRLHRPRYWNSPSPAAGSWPRWCARPARTSAPIIRPGWRSPEGFAAIGCHEALLHGNDIAQGFGLSLEPPRDVCRRVLARIFPQASAELSEAGPVGRAALGRRPHRPPRTPPAPKLAPPSRPR